MGRNWSRKQEETLWKAKAVQEAPSNGEGVVVYNTQSNHLEFISFDGKLRKCLQHTLEYIVICDGTLWKFPLSRSEPFSYRMDLKCPKGEWQSVPSEDPEVTFGYGMVLSNGGVTFAFSECAGLVLKYDTLSNTWVTVMEIEGYVFDQVIRKGSTFCCILRNKFGHYYQELFGRAPQYSIKMIDEVDIWRSKKMDECDTVLNSSKTGKVLGDYVYVACGNGQELWEGKVFSKDNIAWKLMFTAEPGNVIVQTSLCSYTQFALA